MKLNTNPQTTIQGYITSACSVLSQGQVPDWIELLPAPDNNGKVFGRDGRWWSLSNPDAIVKLFGRCPVFGDYEHASEYTYGDPAPASGWVEQLEVRPAVATGSIASAEQIDNKGAVWGRVAWTEKAAEMIRNREYRYISPVFNYSTETNEILEILSFGLTNQPNLELTALNKDGSALAILPVATAGNTRLTGGKQSGLNNEGETTMNLKAICKALGLADEASEDAILTAINTMKDDKQTAINKAETPSADKFVPKADYDIAVNKTAVAEKALNTIVETDFNARVDKAVNTALETGKIAPTSVDYHKSACKSDGDLESFEKTYANAPTIIENGDKSVASNRTADGTSALNVDEKAVCKKMGISEEDFTGSKNSINSEGE